MRCNKASGEGCILEDVKWEEACKHAFSKG